MTITLDGEAPELAVTLRAVYQVARSAVTRDQRAAATLRADRLTTLAVQAGWTRQQIADATGLTRDAVGRRVARETDRESAVPPRLGLTRIPRPPLTASQQARRRRQALVGPAEVSALVGCRPGSVAAWARSRGVPHQTTSGGGKRLYDRTAVLRAAERRPTQDQSMRRPRSVPATPPPRTKRADRGDGN